MARGLFRAPSLKKRISARTSIPRIIRHRIGLKAPRGYGWITNPKKAMYNRVYNKTSIGCVTFFMLITFILVSIAIYFL